MCFRDILCQTNDGEIHLSSCGRFFKLRFNNIWIVNSIYELDTLFVTLSDCYSHVRFDHDIKSKRIVFATQTADLKLYFSPLEIRQLHYLLESAIIKTKEYA